MKIGFMVNDIATEEPGYTTTPPGHGRHQPGPRGLGHRRRGLRLRLGRVRPRARHRGAQEDVQVFRDLPRRPQGASGQARAHPRRRARRAAAAQRPFHRPRPPVLGPVVGHHLRPRGHAHRPHRAQRPQRPGQGHEQDVLPVLPRRGAPADASSPATATRSAPSGRKRAAQSCSSRCRARAARACSSCARTTAPTSTRWSTR